jgi:hypothetical protein
MRFLPHAGISFCFGKLLPKVLPEEWEERGELRAWGFPLPLLNKRKTKGREKDGFENGRSGFKIRRQAGCFRQN